MTPLESRKQLLVAESELNRTQLLQEWQTMADGVHGIAHQARSIGSMASTVVSLIAGLATFRRGPPTPLAEKPSWFDLLLKGVRLASSIRVALRARDQAGKTE